MPKVKTSVTITPETLARARALTGIDNVSDLVDQGLTLLVERELHQRWVDGYLHLPQTQEDHEWAELSDGGGTSDDTNWNALYRESREVPGHAAESAKDEHVTPKPKRKASAA